MAYANAPEACAVCPLAKLRLQRNAMVTLAASYIHCVDNTVYSIPKKNPDLGIVKQKKVFFSQSVIVLCKHRKEQVFPTRAAEERQDHESPTLVGSTTKRDAFDALSPAYTIKLKLQVENNYSEKHVLN